MLIQIICKNFLSHKNTVIDLHEGVNALIGETGAGKSAIFKALDWLFQNKPSGEEYRSWWGGNTEVEVTLKEGQKIGRIRTKSDNYYYIDKQEYRAFGKGSPPQEVLNILNLSDVNFQSQLSPAFLLSNSSGEVARYLNKVAHLDIIDQTLTNISGTLRKEKEELQSNQVRLQSAQQQLIKYDWLPNAEEELEKLESLERDIIQLNIEKGFLTNLLDNYGITEKELKKFDTILEFQPEVEGLIKLHQQIEKDNQQWEVLAGVVDSYEKTESELKVVSKLTKAEDDVKLLLGLVQNIGVQKTERLELENVCKKIEREIIYLQEVERDKGILQKQFDKLMPDRCPLCEQQVAK